MRAIIAKSTSPAMLFKRTGQALLYGNLNIFRCAVSPRLYSTLSDSEIKELHAKLDREASPETINEVLEKGLNHDFSLYYQINNAAHPWSARALRALIESNPGRAFTLASLLERHGQKFLEGGLEKREYVILPVVKKLLEGEKSELKELEEHEVFKPSISRVNKAIALINLCVVSEKVTPFLDAIFAMLVEEDELELLSSLTIQGKEKWLQAKLEATKDVKVKLEVAKLVFGIDPWLLSKEGLASCLRQGGTTEDYGPFVREVLQHIEENHLDLDNKDAESLLLRMQLIQTYMMDTDDVNIALEKFHHYQTFEKFGLQFVQANLVQGFCYQAVWKNDATLLKIADTFVDHDHLSVPTLCQLILSNSRFSSEKSLEIYNQYINLVSKDVNEESGRSATGRLTEALMVANLYDNDREFAQLLYEKAVTSGMVTNEQEIAVMKKVLKVYGDSFVENDWKVAKPIFEKFVLQCIRN